jgi:hypothetical protein
MKLTLGAHDLSKTDESGRFECRPSKAIQHPKFNASYHDIMLLKIKCNVCNATIILSIKRNDGHPG